MILTESLLKQFKELSRTGPEHTRNLRFFQKYRKQWAAAYLDKWAAVYQEELFCLCDTEQEFYELLDEKGIPTYPRIPTRRGSNSP